jgi:lipid II:glycine glycyltransferase (peptidoglycan interpeptide bridge formation enzyme)
MIHTNPYIYGTREYYRKEVEMAQLNLDLVCDAVVGKIKQTDHKLVMQTTLIEYAGAIIDAQQNLEVATNQYNTFEEKESKTVNSLITEEDR